MSRGRWGRRVGRCAGRRCEVRVSRTVGNSRAARYSCRNRESARALSLISGAPRSDQFFLAEVTRHFRTAQCESAGGMSSAVAPTISLHAERRARSIAPTASASSSSSNLRVTRRGIAVGCPLMTMLVGTRPEARAVDYFTTPPNTLEFENVVFPRYPGFVTLPSGVQVKELCVGDGAVATASTRESLELKIMMWTVHQGRSAGETRVRFVPGDGAVIHGIEQAVLAGGGMRVGGTRRALVPPPRLPSHGRTFHSAKTKPRVQSSGSRQRTILRWECKRRSRRG